MRVFAWIIPILDLLGNTFYWLNIFSSSPKFHATYFVRSLLLCVNSSIDYLLSIYLHSSFPHAFHHWHMVLFIFFVANKMLNEQKKMRWKSWWLYNIFIKRRTKGVRCKNSYITGEWLSQLTTTHMHTHTYNDIHKRPFVQIRNAEQLKFLFCLTFAMIRFNQMSAHRVYLLARWLVRSFVHSLFSWNHLTLVDRTFIMNNFIFLPFCSYMSNVYTSPHIILWLFISVVQQRIPIISACNFQLFSLHPSHSNPHTHTHSKWQNEQIQFNNVVNMKINSKWARSSKMLLENPFE